MNLQTVHGVKSTVGQRTRPDSALPIQGVQCPQFRGEVGKGCCQGHGRKAGELMLNQAEFQVCKMKRLLWLDVALDSFMSP